MSWLDPGAVDTEAQRNRIQTDLLLRKIGFLLHGDSPDTPCPRYMDADKAARDLEDFFKARHIGVYRSSNR